jgi:TFIIF-interacting CTD phosphatase-like protein
MKENWERKSSEAKNKAGNKTTKTKSAKARRQKREILVPKRAQKRKHEGILPGSACSTLLSFNVLSLGDNERKLGAQKYKSKNRAGK